MRVDVLVVGLGPAGGAAAAEAARLGLRVAAVERKRRVGVPVQCAEFIPLPLGRYARAQGVLLQRIAGMRSFLPSGAMMRSAFAGLMIDRAAFDQALARQAQAAGAQILLGSRLIGLDFGAQRASVLTPGGGMEIAYGALIAADGPHSAVARCLGEPPLEVVHTRQYTVPLQRPAADTDIWLSPEYPGGYGWLFPKGRLANLGVGADKRLAADLKGPLDRLHRRLMEEGRVGGEIVGRTGGAIPVGGPRARLAVGNVMFAGDAAGLAHPVSGGGIAAAVLSGERAARAAAAMGGGDRYAAAEFEQDIRDQFGAALARAAARRQWLARRREAGAAGEDAVQRRGWIGFPEYFGR